MTLIIPIIFFKVSYNLYKLTLLCNSKCLFLNQYISTGNLCVFHYIFSQQWGRETIFLVAYYDSQSINSCRLKERQFTYHSTVIGKHSYMFTTSSFVWFAFYGIYSLVTHIKKKYLIYLSNIKCSYAGRPQIEYDKMGNVFRDNFMFLHYKV